ncbi:MAG: UDP-glucose dehydrogenase family protein [Beijerinckiaceae bacterium]
MKIAIIGTGYVGLVSGACMADFGHVVTCVDTDRDKIAAIEQGRMPIFEPGLGDLVAKNRRDRRLHFTTELSTAVKGADVVFIAVGTPSRRGDGHADLSYVRQAAEQIAGALTGPCVIVTTSTVPVGTGDEIERIVREARPDVEFTVVSNPEFLREGAAINDFKRPDRIVVGTDDARAREVMAEVYRPLYLNQSPILNTSRRTAELIKYAANAFLATKITFINEVADLCEKVGANVQDVARGIGLDNRIGAKFLHAGPGFGGSCFPKDTRALVQTSHEYGAPFEIVETVVRVNEERKTLMADRVIEACGGSVEGKTIAVLGLAFKPNTDDMRDAPSVPLIQKLQQFGAQVRAYDPEAMTQAADILHTIDYADDAYACAADADAVVIVTEWDAFRALDLQQLKRSMRAPVMIDLRNIYRPEVMAKIGFRYTSIGRPEAADGRK